MADEFKRNIAFKIKIADVLSRPYNKQEGFEPNFIDFGSKKVSRVNIIGVIVSMNTEEGQVSYQNIVLEDGSGRISLRAFDSSVKADVGDIVLVIGKIREFNNDRYIIPEIVKKTDPKWVGVRKKELEILYKEFYDFSKQETSKTNDNFESNTSEDVDEIDMNKNEKSNTNNTANANAQPAHSEKSEISNDDTTKDDDVTKIISIIRKLDKGRGASFEDVLAESSLKNTEQIIKNLLMQGEIFELTPNKFKVLE